ncbi:MAG: type IV pilus assembly protein PilM, partial [Nitrospirae bacterium]|nr:type IV pilus assembly protein PilM [Nitrospirota bacterium]
MTRRLDKLLQVIRRPFRRNAFLTGVDVGKSSFKIVQLTQGRQGPRLVYAGLLEFPRPLEKWDPVRTAVDIQSFLSQKPMKRGPIATAISDAAVTIRYFTLPVMPQDELSEAVQWEAKKLISRPLEEVVLDYIVTGEKEERDLKKMELLLVAADKRTVTEHVLMIRQAGFQAVVVDVNPLALRNLLRLNYPDLIKQNVAVVDIGASNTEISVIKDGEMRFTRYVSIGMDQVTQVIQKELGTSYEEAERLKRRFGLDLARGDVSHEGTKI